MFYISRAIQNLCWTLNVGQKHTYFQNFYFIRKIFAFLTVFKTTCTFKKFFKAIFNLEDILPTFNQTIKELSDAGETVKAASLESMSEEIKMLMLSMSKKARTGTFGKVIQF